MRAYPGAFAGSGGKRLSLCDGAAGLVGQKLGAADGHLGHSMETTCLRVKPTQRKAEPRHGERLIHD